MLDTGLFTFPVMLSVPFPVIANKTWPMLALLQFPIQFNTPLPLKVSGFPLVTVSSQLAATAAVAPTFKFGAVSTDVAVAPWIIPFVLVQVRLKPPWSENVPPATMPAAAALVSAWTVMAPPVRTV
jgi:hypothetical protein